MIVGVMTFLYMIHQELYGGGAGARGTEHITGYDTADTSGTRSPAGETLGEGLDKAG